MTRSAAAGLGAAAKRVAERSRAEALAGAYSLPGLRPREVLLCLLLVSAGRAVTRIIVTPSLKCSAYAARCRRS